MTKRLLTILVSVLVVIFGATSCKKTPVPVQATDKGENIVKFIVDLSGGADSANGIGHVLYNLDITDQPQVIEVVDLRRDLASNADLNKPLTVTVKLDPGVASTYDSQLEPLADNTYSFNEGVTRVGNDLIVKFAAGEFAKTISITIPTTATNFDFSNRYALGFNIASVDGAAKIAGDSYLRNLAYEFGLKNPYDGVYQVSGTFFHPTNAALVGPFGTPSTGGPLECDLITIGSSSVKRDYGAPVGESVIVFNSTSGGLTYFSGVKMRFAVNPATNQVTVYAAPDPGLVAADPTPNNSTYNPGTRTFTLNYGWTSTGGQRRITEVLQYLRPR